MRTENTSWRQWLKPFCTTTATSNGKFFFVAPHLSAVFVKGQQGESLIVFFSFFSKESACHFQVLLRDRRRVVPVRHADVLHEIRFVDSQRLTGKSILGEKAHFSGDGPLPTEKWQLAAEFQIQLKVTIRWGESAGKEEVFSSPLALFSLPESRIVAHLAG